jgi:hypothetical protein
LPMAALSGSRERRQLIKGFDGKDYLSFTSQ